MITATKYQVLFMAWFELVGFLSRDMWGCFFFCAPKADQEISKAQFPFKGKSPGWSHNVFGQASVNDFSPE